MIACDADVKDVAGHAGRYRVTESDGISLQAMAWRRRCRVIAARERWLRCEDSESDSEKEVDEAVEETKKMQ